MPCNRYVISCWSVSSTDITARVQYHSRTPSASQLPVGCYHSRRRLCATTWPITMFVCFILFAQHLSFHSLCSCWFDPWNHSHISFPLTSSHRFLLPSDPRSWNVEFSFNAVIVFLDDSHYFASRAIFAVKIASSSGRHLWQTDDTYNMETQQTNKRQMISLSTCTWWLLNAKLMLSTANV